MTSMNAPVINGRGFEVLVSDKASANEFFAELEKVSYNADSAFFNKWLKFETYRRIVFRDEIWD